MARHHDDDADGIANQADPDCPDLPTGDHACLGENRPDPDSWDDPLISGPTAAPMAVAPAELNDDGRVPL